MLKLDHINVSFGQHHILKNMSCQIDTGDFIVIVGTNGAGKSTFFDTIAGKTQPTSGSITLNGQNITKYNEQQRSSMITRIFQETQLNSVGSLTVSQNLAFAHYTRRNARFIQGTSSCPKEKALQIITNIGLETSILDKPMNTLSGGQRQLIAFAMATQFVPKILLLDEPTAALDPQASTKLLSHATTFIKQHRLTTLLITHDPQIALSIGNKIWVLQDGKIIKSFNQADKTTLKPDELIGQIDYHLLRQL